MDDSKGTEEHDEGVFDGATTFRPLTPVSNNQQPHEELAITPRDWLTGVTWTMVLQMTVGLQHTYRSCARYRRCVQRPAPPPHSIQRYPQMRPRARVVVNERCEQRSSPGETRRQDTATAAPSAPQLDLIGVFDDGGTTLATTPPTSNHQQLHEEPALAGPERCEQRSSPGETRGQATVYSSPLDPIGGFGDGDDGGTTLATTPPTSNHQQLHEEPALAGPERCEQRSSPREKPGQATVDGVAASLPLDGDIGDLSDGGTAIFTPTPPASPGEPHQQNTAVAGPERCDQRSSPRETRGDATAMATESGDSFPWLTPAQKAEEERLSIDPWRRVYREDDVMAATTGIKICLYDTNHILEKYGETLGKADYLIDCFLQWRLFKSNKSHPCSEIASTLARKWRDFCSDPVAAMAKIPKLRGAFNKSIVGRKYLLHRSSHFASIPCACMGFCPSCTSGNRRFDHKFCDHPDYQYLSDELRSHISEEARSHVLHASVSKLEAQVKRKKKGGTKRKSPDK